MELDLVQVVRTWWATELPSETALLDDPDAFFRMKAAEIEERRVALRFMGRSDEQAVEQALEELLPTVLDLDEGSAPTAVLEARARDFLDGALAYAQVPSPGTSTLPQDAGSGLGFEPARVLDEAARMIVDYAEATGAERLTESRALRFPVALALARGLDDTAEWHLSEERRVPLERGVFIGAGPVDLLVEDGTGDLVQWRVGVELKAGDGRLAEVAWDVAKLAAMIADEVLDCGILVVAAPKGVLAPASGRPTGGARLVPAVGEVVIREALSLAEPQAKDGFAEAFKSWATAGQHPVRLPSTIALRGLAEAEIAWQDAGEESRSWVVRAVDVSVCLNEYEEQEWVEWPAALRAAHGTDA